MPKGSTRLFFFLFLLSIGLCAGTALAGISLLAPDVTVKEGDRQVELYWRDLEPESLVTLLEPQLGLPQFPWRGRARPTASGFYVGACDWDVPVTVASTQDSIVLSWGEVTDWHTKATRTRTLKIDETDSSYDFSYGIKVAVPSEGLFDYNGDHWSGPVPVFHGLYRGGAYPDTSVLFIFKCTSGGELGSSQDANVVLTWRAPSHSESGSIAITRAGRSVEVSRGLRVYFPAGQFTSGESLSVDAKLPFGKVGTEGVPPNDQFKVRAQTFEGYLVLRRSVEDRTTPSDTMYKVIADLKRCENPEFFADQTGKQDPYGERYFYDKGIHGSGVGVTPDSTARVVLNGFPYDYAVVTYDWSSDYSLVMSLIRWTKVYPAPAAARTADQVYVVPNPYRFRAAWEQGEAKLQFLNVPEGATIRIFDAAGGYIDTVRPNHRLDGTQNSTADWNLRDSDGKQVTSGIYIFKVDAKTGDKMGRFIVVR
ncbi:MAG TPA: hypothetical protein VMU02_05455 [bacterium]|nr:hypothetical protein [bacterium]